MIQAAKTVGSGVIGALAVTALHETVRQINPKAPRMDVLGMRAISKGMSRLNLRPPSGRRLHRAALVGDIISNSLYYSLVAMGRPRHHWIRGALLGLGAGIGAITLPQRMGLGRRPSRRTKATAAMSVGWYLVGGLAAAAAYQMLRRR